METVDHVCWIDDTLCPDCGLVTYEYEITYVINGVEYRTEVEDSDGDRFYARVCGAVEGVTRAGGQITKARRR
jgi:hypothetical protein